MKVLGIDGSPRQESVSSILLDRALNAAQEEGAELSVIKLVEYNIPPCQGCVSYNGVCNLEECLKHDGQALKEIFEEFISSQVLLFATPVYWFGPSGLMKNLIDRMTCLEHERKLLDGKVGGILCSYEEEGASTTISQLFLALSDMGLVFPPYAYTYNRGKELAEDTVFYAEQLGRNAVKMVRSIKDIHWWSK
jgi:multimeric flavodoxin WrbA